MGLALFALSAGAQSEFEVASVKPNKSGSGAWTFNYGDGKLTAENTSLRDYIRWAYGVKDYQIRGPGWLESDRFDIVAKATSGKDDDDEVMRMLQTLLAERFKVMLHHETKTLPVYRLVIAKGGPRLKRSESQDERHKFQPGELAGQGMRVASLADFLSRHLDRPVIDKTGVKGGFDLDLKFAEVDQPDSPLPSIFTAVQEQLGLRLESAKGPVDVLVIDHAERPDAN